MGRAVHQSDREIYRTRHGINITGTFGGSVAIYKDAPFDLKSYLVKYTYIIYTIYIVSVWFMRRTEVSTWYLYVPKSKGCLYTNTIYKLTLYFES